MKRIIILLCLSLAVLVNGHVFGQVTNLPAQFGPHQWTATVKVVGEDGNPIAGADVVAQYDVPRPQGSDQPTFGYVKGVTDPKGIFIASHADSSWNLGIIVEKTGYYATHTGYEFYFDDKRRHPSFTLLLKKIVNPIPMYAKRVDENPPMLKQPAGYDLMVGDWVAPYGKGFNTDIIFTKVAYRKSGMDYDYKVTVDFPKAGDGIQEFTVPDAEVGSFLRSPYEAPVNGYQNQLIKERYAHPGQPPQSNYDENANYFIRVRTVLDSNGNIKNALYGKIYGDFMQFNYYLNPTPNDQNVEFDPKHNLLGDSVRLP
jgi:hypothetical protein